MTFQFREDLLPGLHFGEFSRLLTQPFAMCAVVTQLAHDARELRFVRCTGIAVYSLLDQIRRAAAVRYHTRQAGGHRFLHDLAEGLRHAGKEEDVCTGEGLTQFIAEEITSEMHIGSSEGSLQIGAGRRHRR